MTPEPANRQSSMKWAWVLTIVLAVVALGLNLFAYLRKPAPWTDAARGPLIVGGIIFMAWAGLLPPAKTGARRLLMGLSLVCVLAGTVLVLLDLFGH